MLRKLAQATSKTYLQHFYSTKSHYTGVLYSLFFINESVKHAIDEMQNTYKSTIMTEDEKHKAITLQFSLFEAAIKAFSKMERDGYLMALHEKISDIHTSNSTSTSKYAEPVQHLEQYKKHHSEEMLQLHKTSAALHEWSKNAHSKKHETAVQHFFEELTQLRQMMQQHFNWEENQLMPVLLQHFSLKVWICVFLCDILGHESNSLSCV